MKETVCVMLTLLISGVLMATVRHVYEEDGAIGIQNAINACSVYDTVYVHRGTYYVRDVHMFGLWMRDSIVLMGEGRDEVILSGLNAAGTDTAEHVIYCSFEHPLSLHESIIMGFTITDGRAVASASECGGGIYCYQSNPVIFKNKITHNSLWGIAAHKSAVIIDSNIVSDNTESGGIYLIDYPIEPPIIRNNLITNNSGTHAGGGIFCNHASFLITNNIISDNYASNYGGGISVFICTTSASNLIVRDNIISNNISDLGGGIDCTSSRAIIESNIISNNVGRLGGGLCLRTSHTPSIAKNLIIHNSALRGGAIWSSGTFPLVKLSLIACNWAEEVGGALWTSWYTVRVDSCLIVDNGSVQSLKSGLCLHPSWGDTLRINNSHVYYNTFQSDIEADNDGTVTMPLEDNFWWFTDSCGIGALIEGPANFSPWRVDFIRGVPGEPIAIDSVRNYDNQYSTVIDSIGGDPDTLFLRVCGRDRNAELREAAIAILKSAIYPDGIAVALIESDTNSGVYEGKVVVKTSTGNDTVRTDDIKQTIRVNANTDTIRITTNIDTTKEFTVFYRCSPGIIEHTTPSRQIPFLEISPNPFRDIIGIRYQIKANISTAIEIYDVAGRSITNLTLPSAHYSVPASVSWNGTDEANRKLPNGVYFLRLTAGDYRETRKLILLR